MLARGSESEAFSPVVLPGDLVPRTEGSIFSLLGYSPELLPAGSVLEALWQEMQIRRGDKVFMIRFVFRGWKKRWREMRQLRAREYAAIDNMMRTYWICSESSGKSSGPTFIRTACYVHTMGRARSMMPHFCRDWAPRIARLVRKGNLGTFETKLNRAHRKVTGKFLPGETFLVGRCHNLAVSE
jgi:hypothetical protein